MQDTYFDDRYYNDEFHDIPFAERYKDRLDDLRWRVGRDLDEAICIFADELMEDKSNPVSNREDLISLIRQSL